MSVYISIILQHGPYWYVPVCTGYVQLVTIPDGGRPRLAASSARRVLGSPRGGLTAAVLHFLRCGPAVGVCLGLDFWVPAASGPGFAFCGTAVMVVHGSRPACRAGGGHHWTRAGPGAVVTICSELVDITAEDSILSRQLSHQ